MSLLTKEGVLDPVLLAHCMFQRDRLRVTAVIETVYRTSAADARQFDSVLLHHKNRVREARAHSRPYFMVFVSHLLTPSLVHSAYQAGV